MGGLIATRPDELPEDLDIGLQPQGDQHGLIRGEDLDGEEVEESLNRQLAEPLSVRRAEYRQGPPGLGQLVARCLSGQIFGQTIVLSEGFEGVYGELP